MPKPSTARATAPETVWLAGGRHAGPAPQEILRENLRRLKADETIHDFLEAENSSDPGGYVFEARWLVGDAVTVRARLTTQGRGTDGREHADGGSRWTLVAEAERPWDPAWPSPATMFWPEGSEVPWDHDIVAGLRLRDINPLPQEDKALRRLLKEAGQHSWSINVVIHEAMTTGDSGRLPLARLLPPGLRHRVVEHRAAPEQFQAVNWALYDLGVRVPRGGAVILPGSPARLGYDEQDHTVRSVFLDGSEPTELLEKVIRYAALPWPLPEAAEDALTGLRQDWKLLTLEEARAQVAVYAEALDAMTKSRDQYREATELAHAALAEVRELRATASGAHDTPAGQDGNPLHQLTRTFQRVAGTVRGRRAARDDARDRETGAGTNNGPGTGAGTGTGTGTGTP
ncbi:hypothetical protein OG840_11950 [Streptomyces sp. NBC_01764]|uniref:hypothetical protein n=1 Tax=Streptomyces sp. NBC_01764 TaxID=2975935 RepID=UPI0022585E2C|nr:hypothetical protein [Streptomyces sp. NBC_01764]MCX4402521.1 hypothetical protein [Streptomyces sp. NBC_01764]